MSSFEKSIRRWTIATFVVYAFTCVFIALQFCEMKSSSRDTHNLAVAAREQAAAAKGLANQAIAQTRIMSQSVMQTGALVKQATAEAKATKETAMANQPVETPWVRVSLALGTGGLTRGADRQLVNVIPAIANVGKSVATDIILRLDYRIPNMNVQGNSPQSEFGIAGGLKKWCDNVKPNVRGSVTEFPGEQRTLPPWGLNVLDRDISRNAYPEPTGLKGYEIFVYGCALYRSGRDTPWRHSGVVYILGRRNPRGILAMLRLGNSYGNIQLALVPWPFNPEYAN